MVHRIGLLISLSICITFCSAACIKKPIPTGNVTKVEINGTFVSVRDLSCVQTEPTISPVLEQEVCNTIHADVDVAYEVTVCTLLKAVKLNPTDAPDFYTKAIIKAQFDMDNYDVDPNFVHSLLTVKEVPPTFEKDLKVVITQEQTPPCGPGIPDSVPYGNVTKTEIKATFVSAQFSKSVDKLLKHPAGLQNEVCDMISRTLGRVFVIYDCKVVDAKNATADAKSSSIAEMKSNEGRISAPKVDVKVRVDLDNEEVATKTMVELLTFLPLPPRFEKDVEVVITQRKFPNDATYCGSTKIFTPTALSILTCFMIQPIW